MMKEGLRELIVESLEQQGFRVQGDQLLLPPDLDKQRVRNLPALVSNGLYSAVSQYAMLYCEPTAIQKRWGPGFRSRREVVRKSLAKAGLSTEWLYHGIQREI